MEHPRYDAKIVKQHVTALQVAQDFGHVTMSSHNQSNAAWRNGDNPQAVFYNEDGTYHDYVLDSHGDAINLYQIIVGCSFQEAVNALGDHYCPQCKLDTYYGAKTAEPPKPAEPPILPPPPLPTPIPTPTQTITKEDVFGLPQPKPVEEQPQPKQPTEWKPVNLPKNKYEELLAKGFKVVAEWPYTDSKGNIQYYVVRLESDKEKEILQRAADGTWGIKDEKRLLYNLPNVILSQKVYIVEGEKCADAMIEHGYVATTVSGGAGKGRWRAEFNDYFRGKDVVILTDCDTKGVDFGKLVCNEVIKVCKTLKIFSPCKDKKQDVADYFLLAEHTNADFDELEANNPFRRPYHFGEVTQDMIDIAKEKNETPFQNYKEIDDEKTGRKKQIPIQPITLMSDFFARFLNFPCLLGQDVLFDHDRDTREIKSLSSYDELFAWISVKTKQNYQWASKAGYMLKKEFFFAVKQNAHRFELISETPDYPHNEKSYYLHPELPPPSANHEYFNHLIDFFSPADENSKLLIKTLFMAPMWYRFGSSRPSWVIDSANGKGAGKSTLYRKLALLYKCDPIQVNRSTMQLNPDELDKRLVSNTGRKSKFFVIDNVVGAFHSEVLARYITSDTLSGRAPYSAGEDSRPNNLTYILTGNGFELDGDLASRSFFIKLKTPENPIPDWETKINDYISRYRWQIFSDMLDIFRRHTLFNLPTRSRYELFEKEVLQAVCETEEIYKRVMDSIFAAAESANTDAEEAQRLVTGIRYKIADLLHGSISNPDTVCAWIQSDVLKVWTQDICGHSISSPAIRQFVIDGYTANFDGKLDKFPRSSSKKQTRGVMWIGDKADRTIASILSRQGQKGITSIDMDLYCKDGGEAK